MATEVKRTDYGLTATLSDSFPQAVERVKEAFRAEGFGVLTESDIQGTLREKLGEEMEPYTILGMCNPRLASRAIRAESEVGLLLPCTVLVREQAGAVHVSAQDPAVFFGLVKNEEVRPLAEEASGAVERAFRSLAAGPSA